VTQSPAEGRLYALDGLRFLAALMVLLTHYLSAGWVYWHGSSMGAFEPLQPVVMWGWMGVNLFFIISGFAISMSSWGRGLGSFFSSRASRLFPAYVVCVLITFAVTYTFQFRDTSASDLAVNLTMLQVPYGAPSVDGAYWTLWQELLFYLAFAFVVWRGVTYRRVLAFCLIWTVAAALAVASGVPFLQAIAQREYFMYFVAGVVMYLMRRFGPNLLLWSILGVSLLLAIHAQGPTILSYYGDQNYRRHWVIGACVIVLCFALVLVMALGWFDRIRWRALTTAGAVTYPLYLLHAYIGWMVIDRFSAQTNPWALLGTLVGGMLISAYLVHRLVERPFASRIRRRLNAAFAAASADQVATQAEVRVHGSTVGTGSADVAEKGSSTGPTADHGEREPTVVLPSPRVTDGGPTPEPDGGRHRALS
jgi:peptidoglycan/LPS O-acetylase OafA/YrhL